MPDFGVQLVFDFNELMISILLACRFHSCFIGPLGNVMATQAFQRYFHGVQYSPESAFMYEFGYPSCVNMHTFVGKQVCTITLKVLERVPDLVRNGHDKKCASWRTAVLVKLRGQFAWLLK